MGLEELIAKMYETNTNLPLGYGQLWNNTYKPAFDFQNQMGTNNANFQSSQGNNRAGVAQSGIGATGNIATAGIGAMGNLGSSAINSYGGVAGLDAQAQQFNSLSPVLAGLMSQYAPAGSQALPSIAPMKQNYLGGYGDMVNQGYGNVNSQVNQGYGNVNSQVNSGYGQLDKNQSEYGDAQSGVRQDFGDAFRDQMNRMPKNPWENQAPNPVSPPPTVIRDPVRYPGNTGNDMLYGGVPYGDDTPDLPRTGGGYPTPPNNPPRTGGGYPTAGTLMPQQPPPNNQQDRLLGDIRYVERDARAQQAPSSYANRPTKGVIR